MTDKEPRTQTHVVQTEDGDIKITQPTGRKRSQVTVLLGQPDDLVRDQARGFINFLREHAVVGLAVGFIIGLQAQTLVKQLADSFITPLLNVFFGDVLNKHFIVHTSGGPIAFEWGKFIYALLDFMFVLFFVYLVIKVLKLDRLDKPKAQK